MGGETEVKRRPPTGKSVSVRVRVVRAGEAKLRGRAGEMIPPSLVSNQDKCLVTVLAGGGPSNVPWCPVVSRPVWQAVARVMSHGVPLVSRGVPLDQKGSL